MIIDLSGINFGGSGSGSGGGMSLDQELVISQALNDLNDRLEEIEQ